MSKNACPCGSATDHGLVNGETPGHATVDYSLALFKRIRFTVGAMAHAGGNQGSRIRNVTLKQPKLPSIALIRSMVNFINLALLGLAHC